MYEELKKVERNPHLHPSQLFFGSVYKCAHTGWHMQEVKKHVCLTCGHQVAFENILLSQAAVEQKDKLTLEHLKCPTTLLSRSQNIFILYFLICRYEHLWFA